MSEVRAKRSGGKSALGPSAAPGARVRRHLRRRRAAAAPEARPAAAGLGSGGRSVALVAFGAWFGWRVHTVGRRGRRRGQGKRSVDSPIRPCPEVHRRLPHRGQRGGGADAASPLAKTRADRLRAGRGRSGSLTLERSFADGDATGRREWMPPPRVSRLCGKVCNASSRIMRAEREGGGGTRKFLMSASCRPRGTRLPIPKACRARPISIAATRKPTVRPVLWKPVIVAREPLPRWRQPRPSAADPTRNNALPSGRQAFG